MFKKNNLFTYKIGYSPIFLSPTLSPYNTRNTPFIVDPPSLSLEEKSKENNISDDELDISDISDDDINNSDISDDDINNGDSSENELEYESNISDDKNMEYSIISLTEDEKKKIEKENIKIPLETNKGILKFINRGIKKIEKIISS